MVARINQLNKAVLAPPMWRKPVGRGKSGNDAHSLQATFRWRFGQAPDLIASDWPGCLTGSAMRTI